MNCCNTIIHATTEDVIAILLKADLQIPATRVCVTGTNEITIHTCDRKKAVALAELLEEHNMDFDCEHI